MCTASWNNLMVQAYLSKLVTLILSNMSSAQAAALSAQQFFSGATRFAVVGASADRNKYGNKVLVRNSR